LQSIILKKKRPEIFCNKSCNFKGHAYDRRLALTTHINTFIKPDMLPIETLFEPSNERISFITTSNLTRELDHIMGDIRSTIKKKTEF